MGGGNDDNYGGGTGRKTGHGEHAARSTEFKLKATNGGYKVYDGTSHVCDATGFLTDGCDIRATTGPGTMTVRPYESGGRVDLYKQGKTAKFVYEASGDGGGGGGMGGGLGFGL